MSNSLEASRPWYRQPWLWFILTPLIAVFIVGTSFAYLSVVTFDGMVKGDYAKTAKSFNIDASRLTQAKTLGLQGDLVLDAVTGDIRLSLQSNTSISGEQLVLEVIHPTVVELDQDLILARRPDGNFYGTLAKNIDGKRYLHLSDQENTWRMTKEVHTPWPTTVTFLPNQP